MSALFLAPHNDDETLFGAFTLIRHRPHVVVVLRSFSQESAHGFQRQQDFAATSANREVETERALEALGLDPYGHLAATPGVGFEQWEYLDDAPDWEAIEHQIRICTGLQPQGRWDRVFAPAVEPEGHPHHSALGALADNVFGVGVTHYMTYTNGRGRSGGRLVAYEYPWIALKLRALACYESQIRLASTAHHFMQPLHEYYQT